MRARTREGEGSRRGADTGGTPVLRGGWLWGGWGGSHGPAEEPLTRGTRAGDTEGAHRRDACATGFLDIWSLDWFLDCSGAFFSSRRSADSAARRRAPAARRSWLSFMQPRWRRLRR